MTGQVWRLHGAGEEIARLTVTGGDFPWMHGTVEMLPGFGEYERADGHYERIRETLTMTFPDGEQVAEFWLQIHGDGTAGWRWSDEPFDD